MNYLFLHPKSETPKLHYSATARSFRVQTASGRRSRSAVVLDRELGISLLCARFGVGSGSWTRGFLIMAQECFLMGSGVDIYRL